MNKNSMRRRAAERRRAVRGVKAPVVCCILEGTMKKVLRHSGESGNPAVFADKDAGFPPSLDIRGSGDLDLTGLSFIDGVEGGFRVGASFNLDWTGGEQAWRPFPASTWSGLDSLPRSLSIIAGGSIDFSTVLLSLDGGSISLAAGSTLNIGDGSVIDVGGSGATPVNGGGSGGVVLIGDPNVTLRPTIPVRGGGSITIQPGGNLAIGGPSPIPEPTTAALLLAGLAWLAGVFGRRARAGR